MTKAEFKERLKRMGYTVDNEASIPTILIVDASSETIKKTYIDVKLVAQKLGYHHSISVKNLKEENANEHANN